MTEALKSKKGNAITVISKGYCIVGLRELCTAIVPILALLERVLLFFWSAVVCPRCLKGISADYRGRALGPGVPTAGSEARDEGLLLHE